MGSTGDIERGGGFIEQRLLLNIPTSTPGCNNTSLMDTSGTVVYELSNIRIKIRALFTVLLNTVINDIPALQDI